MTKEELKNKCTERAKIFQQAIGSCKSSNPIDCIEWFADRIVELDKECAEVWGKLTKAKELLKETQGYIENNDDELYDKIEQFLKEIEK